MNRASRPRPRKPGWVHEPAEDIGLHREPYGQSGLLYIFRRPALPIDAEIVTSVTFEIHAEVWPAIRAVAASHQVECVSFW